MARSDIRKVFDERFKDKPIDSNAMNELSMILQLIVDDMKISRPSYRQLSTKYGINKAAARRLRYKAAIVLGIN